LSFDFHARKKNISFLKKSSKPLEVDWGLVFLNYS
jgi:hypothetical protein